MIKRSSLQYLLTIALDALMGVMFVGPSAAATRTSIPNDSWWYDVGGGFMSTQGGSVLKVGSVYYWVGTQFAQTGGYPFGAVNLYKSTDLVNWNWVKALLTPQTSGDLAAGRWVGRPDLVFNPSTNRYILVLEIDGSGSNIGPGNKIGFASSPTVEGNYTYHGSTAVNGSTMGDHSVFVDGNSAYLLYSGDTPNCFVITCRNVTMNIAPLASNWLSVEPAIFSQANGGREAPAIIKIGSKYHWFTSGTDWWDSTATKHRVSTSLTAWPAWTTLATSPASPDSFNTQFDFVIPITGSSGTSYIVAADRYTNFQGQEYPAPTGIGRNAWMPLTFSGDTPTLHGYSDLTIDLATGLLGGNAAANSRFENEGPTQSPASWQEWGDTASSYSESGGVSGNRLTFWNSSAFETHVYQWLTGLPNGTYTLTLSMLGSGTHNSALLIAKPSNGAEVKTSLNIAANDWTSKSVSFTVVNGQTEIAIYVDGTPNSWLMVDNVSLRRS